MNDAQKQSMLFSLAARACQARLLPAALQFQDQVNQKTIHSPCMDILHFKKSITKDYWLVLMNEAFIFFQIRSTKNWLEEPGVIAKQNDEANLKELGSLSRATPGSTRIRLLTVEGRPYPFKVWKTRDNRTLIQLLVINDRDIRSMHMKRFELVEPPSDEDENNEARCGYLRKVVLAPQICHSNCEMILEQIKNELFKSTYQTIIFNPRQIISRRWCLDNPEMVD